MLHVVREAAAHSKGHHRRRDLLWVFSMKQLIRVVTGCVVTCGFSYLKLLSIRTSIRVDGCTLRVVRVCQSAINILVLGGRRSDAESVKSSDNPQMTLSGVFFVAGSVEGLNLLFFS